jgi:predicted ATP-grasp superfamily ATP-dependent carboligase
LVDLSIARREALLADLSPTQVVLQDRIDTNRPIVSVCAFSICGRVNGLFGYEKLRQHPDRFGTGSYLRSVPVDAWKPVAEQILGTLHYTGISEIEFIHDPSRDAYRVIEMNPRPWKSVHFATQCGQNLVARHLSWVGGVEPEPGFEYATGRYWTDLATDLRQMLRERTLFRWNRGVFECTWDRSDPVPAVVLWTLFPLISWENHLEEREAAKRDGTGAFRWPASACVDVPVRMGSATGDSA